MTPPRWFAKNRVALLVAGFMGAAVASTSGIAPAFAREVLGVPLPNGAVETGPNRFRSPLGYGATLEWLTKELKKSGATVKFRSTVDLPDVVSSHADAPDAQRAWSGINVSEYEGSVKIFVVAK